LELWAESLLERGCVNEDLLERAVDVLAQTRGSHLGGLVEGLLLEVSEEKPAWLEAFVALGGASVLESVVESEECEYARRQCEILLRRVGAAFE
jgi:hypothetical protein